MAISKARQDWSVGSIVKAGFLEVRVVAKGHDASGKVSCCESLDGSKAYIFQPHQGIERVGSKDWARYGITIHESIDSKRIDKVVGIAHAARIAALTGYTS